MASRTPAEIEAQKAAALALARSQLQSASQDASIQSTPPGYISGFKIVLTSEYKIDIYPGICNVAGVRVEHRNLYTLKPEDEQLTRLSKQWWYIYIDKEGKFYGDIIPPVYNDIYFAYQHPNHPWRNIGKYFTCDDHLCRFASDWQQQSEQTVYVAPADFGGVANYYCTGDNDQILINAAIQYLHEAYDGGKCSLLPGTYEVTSSAPIGSDVAAVYLYSNITVDGFYGGAKINATNIISAGRSAVFADYVGANNVTISGITFLTTVGCTAGSQAGCIVFLTTDIARITDCVFNCGLVLHVIAAVSCANLTIKDNTIEIGTPPTTINTLMYIDGTLSTICNNYIKNISTTGSSLTCIGVNDNRNNVYANHIYNITQTHITGQLYGIYVSDNLNIISENILYGLSTTGLYVRAINVSTGSSYNKITGNYCYNNGSDTGIANLNLNNYYNAGTDTQVYSNSWQQPNTGELSLGTKHPCYVTVFSTATAITATTMEITLTSTQVPIGSARSIDVFGYVYPTATSNVMLLKDIAALTHVGAKATSTQYYYYQGSVKISSTGGFRLTVSSTNDTVKIFETNYYC